MKPNLIKTLIGTVLVLIITALFGGITFENYSLSIEIKNWALLLSAIVVTILIFVPFKSKSKVLLILILASFGVMSCEKNTNTVQAPLVKHKITTPTTIDKSTPNYPIVQDNTIPAKKPKPTIKIGLEFQAGHDPNICSSCCIMLPCPYGYCCDHVACCGYGNLCSWNIEITIPLYWDLIKMGETYPFQTSMNYNWEYEIFQMPARSDLIDKRSSEIPEEFIGKYINIYEQDFVLDPETKLFNSTKGMFFSDKPRFEVTN